MNVLNAEFQESVLEQNQDAELAPFVCESSAFVMRYCDGNSSKRFLLDTTAAVA